MRSSSPKCSTRNNVYSTMSNNNVATMYQEIADPDELFAMPFLSSGPLAGLDAVLFRGRSPAQTEVKL